MPKKINSRFSRALTTSIVLHIVLIAVLGYSAWQYVSPSAANNSQGESIDAIMVDSAIMTQQYQRQVQHQLSSQQVKQQLQQQIEKQAQALQQQLAEQQRLKELEKEKLLAIEKQKQETDAAAKALAEKQRIEAERQKAEQEKQKALAEAEKVKLEAEKQKKVLEQERLKAEKEKQDKLKAQQEAKQKALDEQQKQRDLDDILGGLTSSVPKSQQGVSTGELDQFRSQITNAISNKFINPKLYSGKNCVLKIKIASDGLLLKVDAQGGDPTLCREAISATNAATFPKPKSDQLYQQVKEMTIDFRPK
ncbi:cell envelope integrity protein TolA [Orbus mooreae]|uniref:cell envelope integrity protein TolA n=1 Tax=Orbus mooreae TaxID=3074107 RepID=UPI00370D86C4